MKEKPTRKPPNFIKFNGKKGKRTWFCCRFWRLRGLWNPSRRRGKEVPGSKDRVEFWVQRKSLETRLFCMFLLTIQIWRKLITIFFDDPFPLWQFRATQAEMPVPMILGNTDLGLVSLGHGFCCSMRPLAVLPSSGRVSSQVGFKRWSYTVHAWDNSQSHFPSFLLWSPLACDAWVLVEDPYLKCDSAGEGCPNL